MNTVFTLRDQALGGQPVLPGIDALTQQLQTLDTYHSLIHIMGQDAQQQAQAVQQRLHAGEKLPLAGVPIAIKDNLCVKDVPTTCASKMLGNFKPPYDATVVKRLRDAGAIIVAKTNMDEFAMGSTSETSAVGAALNPWNTAHVPGGSSGGSAAAVAAGLVPVALGSDTGGSIRQPSAYCGVTGLKPTYGAVSRYGLIAYASSLDQIGPIARTAKEAAAVLDVICGKDVHDATSTDGLTGGSILSQLNGDVRGMKIGLPRQYFGEGLSEDVRTAVLQAADTLRGLGATVEECDLPMLDYAIAAYYIIACAEAASNLSRYDGVEYGHRAQSFEDLYDLYAATRSEGFGMEVKRRIMLGNYVLSAGYYDAYYIKALKIRRLIKQAFDGVFAKYDMVLGPVAPTAAPKLGESLSDPLKMYLTDIYTVSVNLAGLPGISVPCGFNGSGLPIGMQLIGPAFADAALLRVADAYQQATDHHTQTPAARRDA